jgi:orotidine-5'-phosphate decarboxylase
MFRRLQPRVRFFKLGLEAYSACGPSIVRRIKEEGGRVFLDLKYHDIPRTVHRACRAALDLGVDLLNVHAGGGGQMMREAARAREAWRCGAGAGDDSPFPAIIGVTLLTHIGPEEFETVFGPRPSGPEAFVERLAILARDSGLQGIVASGREAPLIRKTIGKDFLIVTPGVRPAGADDGGHARKVTPLEALRNGSDMIVMGRPITGAKDPAAAAGQILSMIEPR